MQLIQALVDLQEDYEASKATQPEFYRAGDSLQYGVAPKLPQRNVELMVAELNEQRAKKQAYSRRWGWHAIEYHLCHRCDFASDAPAAACTCCVPDHNVELMVAE